MWEMQHAESAGNSFLQRLPETVSSRCRSAQDGIGPDPYPNFTCETGYSVVTVLMTDLDDEPR